MPRQKRARVASGGPPSATPAEGTTGESGADPFLLIISLVPNLEKEKKAMTGVQPWIALKERSTVGRLSTYISPPTPCQHVSTRPKHRGSKISTEISVGAGRQYIFISYELYL